MATKETLLSSSGLYCELEPEPATTQADEKLDPAYYAPLTISLLSTLFYLMNYYITAPSATLYVNALGSHDALSATLIGVMPLAALCTSFVYSWWTNYSYKAPMIFTSVVLCVGNLLYASALSMDSLPAALLGRFITGLGHQRTINKRFIADTAPATFKTSVSAAFSVSQALGMSLGPGIAIALGRLDYDFDLPILGTRIILNGMTGPGYFMFAVWFLYFIVVILKFDEPERTGLHELKRKEDKEKEDNTILCESKLQVYNAPSWVSVLSNDEGDATVNLDAMSFDVVDFKPESAKGDEATGEEDTGEKSFLSYGCMDAMESMTTAIWLVMFLLFTNKFSIEMVISSTSTLTKNRYSWELREVGILGVVDGIMVIPLSFLVGWLSHRFEDKVLLSGLLSLSVFGVALLVDPTDLLSRMRSDEYYNSGMRASVGPTQYIIGSLLSFASLQACESVITSQLSKVVPHILAKGTFNSGLLSTLIGAGARIVGCFFITLMGYISLRNLMNLIFMPALSLLVTCLVLTRTFYMMFVDRHEFTAA